MNRSHLVLTTNRYRTCGAFNGSQVIQTYLLSEAVADEDSIKIELAGTVGLIKHDDHIGVAAVLLELGCSNTVHAVADLCSDGLHRQVVGVCPFTVYGDFQLGQALVEVGPDFGNTLEILIDQVANLFCSFHGEIKVVTLDRNIDRIQVAKTHGHLAERETGCWIEIEVTPQLILHDLHGIGTFLIEQGYL
ncbi:hypothetical protein DSECCO2_526070 [anaerobic digester metagenome]